MDVFSGFNEVYQNRHQIAQEWKESGNKVFGYIYSAAPEELMYAAGALPVQLMASEDQKTVIKGETILPEFLCDYSQSCLGQILEGTYGYLDGLVIPDACATIRTLWRAWEVHINIPYRYFFNPPFESTEESRIYYTKEMNRFKKSLEDFCGGKISDENLRSAIEVYNENRSLMKELYRLRSEGEILISAEQVLEVVRAGLVTPKDAHSKILRKALELLPRIRQKQKGKIPLFLSMVTFEHCMTDDLNIPELIEQVGGKVASDDLWMGPRYFSEPVVLDSDLIEALVDRYLGKIPAGFRFPLKPRLDWLLEQIGKHDIKGGIFIIPKYCHPYLFEYPYIERNLKERGIPTLFLESEAGMPREPLRVRLQAFMEMLV